MSRPEDELQEQAMGADAPAQQRDFFRIPARFGAIPSLAEHPLGFDPAKRFEEHFARLALPFQIVERVETAAALRNGPTDAFPDGLNRLFFGDCLHVMRMLPSEAVDLIYIDPPFFSGRAYNIVFGDRNEVRSFSDIWEGGMPGYLIWLNARLFEMKRLLRKTGSIVVHCDWHASHYIKVELDKLFGYESFRNEIVWGYHSGGASARYFGRKHDVLLWYAKDSKNYHFDDSDVRVPYTESTLKAYNKVDANGRYKIISRRDGTKERVYANNLERGRLLTDVWEDIPHLANWSGEKVGYPTQKPEKLLDRVIRALCPPTGTVADFLCGGGTTLAVAQSLGRQWIGCDVSRVAVAITGERIARILAPRIQALLTASGPEKIADESSGTLTLDLKEGTAATSADTRERLLANSPVQMVGHTVEHFGIYDIRKLMQLSVEEFRKFILACCGARRWTGADQNIHGTRGNEVIWTGSPEETNVISATDVRDFAQALIRSRSPADRNGVMIAWNVDPSARAYAERVVVLGQQRPAQAIRLKLFALASAEFRAHVVGQRGDEHAYLSFVLPPEIPRIGIRRISSRHYEFDISEARSMNPGGVLTNAQWDFSHRGLFAASPGYDLCRRAAGTGFLATTRAEYTFEAESPGESVTVACRIQDDLGGEQTRTTTLVVE